MRLLKNSSPLRSFGLSLICGLILSSLLHRSLWAGDVPPSPRPQLEIEHWMDIEWTLGTDLPRGFQDSDGGILGSELITVGGFCSGGLEEDNRRKPGKYPRGFMKTGWSLDLSRPNSNWINLPDFPGDARQGLFAAKVGNSLYFWGGFSYSAPYCYQDGYSLSRASDGQWSWSRLPDLPWKTSSAGICCIGPKIYMCGGADYDGETGFFTEHTRDKQVPRLGARLLVCDTEHLDQGWKELTACPGTPRFVMAFQPVGGKLYLIGGATGDVVKEGQRYGYCTVVDNWSYDPATDQWSRLRDLPVSSGNFPKSSNLVFMDRYLILPGGHQYTYIVNPDGTIRSSYGKAGRKRPESGLHNDVFVYDTLTNQFGRGDSLPIDNNLPMSVVQGNKLYLIGGETGGGEIHGQYYGHHPDLLLIGTLKLSRP